jgi:hypothetical protein
MAGAATNPKQQAHELIDRLSVGQASAVVNLLEAMLDPVSAALASASMDDEPTSEGRGPGCRGVARCHRPRRGHLERRGFDRFRPDRRGF